MTRFHFSFLLIIPFMMPALMPAAAQNTEENLQIACLTDDWKGINCTPADLQATARLVQSVGKNQHTAGLISLFCNQRAGKQETFAHCIDMQLEAIKTHPIPDTSHLSPDVAVNARRYCGGLSDGVVNETLARYFDCLAKGINHPELVSPEQLKKEYEARFAAPAPRLIGPSLKGHRLGETTAMFISAAPVFKRYLTQCRLHPRDFDDSGESGLLSASGVEVSSHCTDAIQLAASPRASVRIARGFDTDIGVATEAAMAATFGASTEFNEELENTASLPLDFSGAIQFEQGLAVYIEVRMNTNWEDSERDLDGKFGKPSRLSHSTVQNEYGARNELVEAYWEHADYVVHTFESILRQQRFVTVEMLTREFYDRAQQKQNARPNSLD